MRGLFVQTTQVQVEGQSRSSPGSSCRLRHCPSERCPSHNCVATCSDPCKFGSAVCDPAPCVWTFFVIEMRCGDAHVHHSVDVLRASRDATLTH